MDAFLGKSEQSLLAWADDPAVPAEPKAAAAGPEDSSGLHMNRWQGSAFDGRRGEAWQQEQEWWQQASGSWQHADAASWQDASSWQGTQQQDASWQAWQDAGQQPDPGQQPDAGLNDALQQPKDDEPRPAKRPGKNKERGGKHKAWYSAYWGAIAQGKSSKDATALADYAEL